MHLINWGVNHHSTEIDFREKISIPNSDVAYVIKELENKGYDESLVLSTCNRTEIYACSNEKTEGLNQLVAKLKEVDVQKLSRVSYTHGHLDAVEHLFRVTSSMDSMVIGEPEITGQVKDAYQRAKELGSVKKVLNALFQRSFKVAKKIRTETELANRPTSIGAVAANLAVQIFGVQGAKEILVLGAGDMAEVSLRNLVGQLQDCKIKICNRTKEKADLLAVDVGAEVVDFDEWMPSFSEADIVISSLGVEQVFIKKKEIEPMIEQRNGRPLFIIDLGLPRNVEASMNQIEDIYLYDLDDLQHNADENKEQRRKILETCEPYIKDGVNEFESWMISLDHQSIISDLMKRNESYILEDLEKYLKKYPVHSDQQKEDLHYLIKKVVKKTMHQPIHALRNSHEIESKEFSWRKFFLGKSSS